MTLYGQDRPENDANLYNFDEGGRLTVQPLPTEEDSPDAGEPVIFMTLTDPPPSTDPEDRERWDHSCDRCGAHRPDDLRLAHYRAARGLVLGVGLCPSCTRRERLS